MKKFLFVLAMFLLPTALFAKGDVVAYQPDYRAVPTDDQLSRITHLVLFSITPGNNGTVPMPSGGWAGNIKSVVDKAHAKNVKVIIALGGDGKTGTFPASVQAANRQTFVNNIVAMVDANNFDGVDIDWEYPETTTEKNNFAEFMAALKTKLGSKRLSFAVGADPEFGPTKFPKKAYDAMDALHIMAYDMNGNYTGAWGSHHADETKAKQKLDEWLNSGQIAKEKVFLGVPFYGRSSSAEETYSGIIKNNPAQYSQVNTANGWYYDGIPTIKSKTRYAYEQGAGGIMIWEIGQDVAATSPYSLLNAIWQQTQDLGGGGGGNQQVTNYNISVTYNSGGTVRNGSSTVNSGSSISVQSGNSLTLTIAANSGYSISDVKVDGASKGKITTYTFSNVTKNQSINVTFAQNGTTPTPPNPPAGDAPDLADGTWGDSAWSKIWDKGENGSTLNITKQGNPLTANWTLGSDPGDVDDDDEYPYVGIGFIDGDWSGVTQIEIKYSVDKPTYIALNSKNEHEYYVELEVGNNKTKTITPSQFVAFDWDKGAPSLKMSEVEGISLSALDSYGLPTNLTVTSLIVRGLVIEDDPEPTPPGPNPIAQNKTKTVSSVGASVINGNINLSLPSSANSANVVLFDVRGRILFERSVAVNANFTSVALPKSLLRNQAAILQVKTNSGFNMTKRILIK